MTKAKKPQKVLEITVAVPKCWRKLVQKDFPANLKGIKSEKTDHFGVADPQPHYDDARYIDARFDNGTRFLLQLCSGQSNYWGGYTFDASCLLTGTREAVVIDSEPLEAFDTEYDAVIDGVRYLVHINYC